MTEPHEILGMSREQLEELKQKLEMTDATWQAMRAHEMSDLQKSLYFWSECQRLYDQVARLTERKVPFLYSYTAPKKDADFLAAMDEAVKTVDEPPKPLTPDDVLNLKHLLDPAPKKLSCWKIMLSPPGSCHVIENGKLIGVASGSVNATRLGSTAYLSRIMVMGQRELPDWIVVVDHEDRILVQGNPREKSDSACFLESENTSVYTDIRIEQKTHELVFRPGSLDREYKPVRSCDDCDHSTVSKDNDNCRTCRNHSNWLAAMEGSGQ